MKTSKSANPLQRFFAPAILAVVLIVIFWKAFLPDFILFANDGPLGVQNTQWLHLPQAFSGQWYDLTTLGTNQGAAVLDIGTLIRWVLGAVGYAKFVVPISLWLLGFGAWFCFRRMGMSSMASILGGLAACLTTNYFSNGCWGAAPPIIAFGMDFLALGALAKKDKYPFWVAPALAGLAVGMNVMEAADIGALFSVVIAVFVMYQSLVEEGSSIASRAARGVGRTVIVAVFAFFIAAYAIHSLFGSSITGISGTKEDAQSKAMRWDFASQWSLPKRETISLFIPGVFGDRVDFPDERMYWGGMGRDASWERYFHAKLEPGESVRVSFPGKGENVFQIDNNGSLALPMVAPIKAAGMTRIELQKKITELYTPAQVNGVSIDSPQGFMRHTGRGFYFGVMVVLVGLWAALQSLRGNNSVFTSAERKLIWFWSVAAVVAVIVAQGRFSPFSSFFYWLYITLPGTSTVRSPEKFLHVANLAAIILFAYGINGLNRRCLESQLVEATLGTRIQRWWAKAPAFDRRWVLGSLLAVVLVAVGWVVYGAFRTSVVQYMEDVQVPPSIAQAMSAYSFHQVGWFLLFLAADAFVLLLILSGSFAGRKVKWAGIVLGLLLVSDLVRADMPYVVFWNYKQKYETYGLNPVVKFLTEKPYENRVAELPAFRESDMGSTFHQLYAIEWIQQLFPYYNIQSLDIVQMSRMPQDLEAYQRSQQFPGAPIFTRNWELSNTRYLLGPADYLEPLNQQLDPVKRRFRIINTFGLTPKPGVDQTTQLSQITVAVEPPPHGQYALFEFTGALPRAKLYSSWQTNSPAALAAFTTNGLTPIESYVLSMLGTSGTNEFLILKQIQSPSFDPMQTVLLTNQIPPPSTNSLATNQSPGTVEFTSYWPSDVKLKAVASAPSVLLLNDKFDPDWHVWVDGKEDKVLKCNFLMRGVYLQPGQHEVEFRFMPSVKMLYVNVAALFVGVCLLGYVALAKRDEPDEAVVAVREERPIKAFPK